MPKGLVKTKADEEAWARAKARAHDQYGPEEDDGFWAIVNHIFGKMSGRHKKKEKRAKKKAAELVGTLDAVASDLHARGLLKMAEALDIVANSIDRLRSLKS